MVAKVSSRRVSEKGKPPKAASKAPAKAKPARPPKEVAQPTGPVNKWAEHPPKKCTSCKQDTHSLECQANADNPHFLVWTKTSASNSHPSGRRLCGSECYRCCDLRKTNVRNEKGEAMTQKDLEDARDKDKKEGCGKLDDKWWQLRGMKERGEIAFFDNQHVNVGEYYTKEEKRSYDEWFEEGLFQEIWSWVKDKGLPFSKKKDSLEDVQAHIKSKYKGVALDYDDAGVLGVVTLKHKKGVKAFRRGIQNSQVEGKRRAHRNREEQTQHMADLVGKRRLSPAQPHNDDSEGESSGSSAPESELAAPGNGEDSDDGSGAPTPTPMSLKKKPPRAGQSQEAQARKPSGAAGGLEKKLAKLNENPKAKASASSLASSARSSCKSAASAATRGSASRHGEGRRAVVPITQEPVSGSDEEPMPDMPEAKESDSESDGATLGKKEAAKLSECKSALKSVNLTLSFETHLTCRPNKKTLDPIISSVDRLSREAGAFVTCDKLQAMSVKLSKFSSEITFRNLVFKKPERT